MTVMELGEKKKPNPAVKIKFSGGLANKLHVSIKSTYLISTHPRLGSMDFEAGWHN